MRKKRNEKNTTLSTDGYIKKYFGNDIGRILVPSSRSLQNCEIPYVSHPEAESNLKNCLVGDPLRDKSLVFTGLTGSGKTTIIRHVFGLEVNANRPVIKEDVIIIPLDFNRSQKSALDAILSSLRSAVQKIVDIYEIDFPDVYNERFYSYVEDRRPDFLFLDAKHNQSTPHEERMNVFLEQMATTFASLQLQYVMDHSACNLSLCVLIVDNVEAFRNPNAKDAKTKYLLPIIEAFKLAECIGQRGDFTKWQFNMLIACRHHIWRIMKGEFTDNSYENILLQSYVTTETPYDLTNPININAIIKEREKIFSRKQKNLEKWNEAVKVVNTILKKMENGIGDFVTQLELKDMRKSMSTMQNLILHKGLQKQTDEEIVTSGAFQIDSVEQFDLSRVNLIRVLGLGNYKYYADLNSIVPNLLNNNYQGSELYIMLTLKYFLIRCGYVEPAWDNPISISEFYETMKIIFSYVVSESNNYFEQAILYLVKNRMLLRSADQQQDEVPGLSKEEMLKIEHVYVSGAAIKMWEELGKSSALFQLFLDDIWLDENESYFEENGNDIEHCIKYLNGLWETEKKIFYSAKNKSRKSEEYYIKTFGVTPICKQLINGLIASLEAIGRSNDSRSQMRRMKAKDTLKKTDRLFNELTEWEKSRKKLESTF